MMDPYSRLSVRQARLLLHLENHKSSLTKSQIQQAFVRAAKMHHPDRRHSHDATPCAERFQRALEAKEVLLAHHCGGRRTTGVYSRSQGGFGFPTHRLRILTLRQNLLLRGIVLTTITFGVMYDEWSRKQRKVSSRDISMVDT